MKTRFSNKLIILYPILGLFLLAFLLFGLLIIYRTIQEFDFMGLIVGSVFLWMSIGFGSLLIDKVIRFEISNGTLIIKYVLTGRMIKTELSNVKYKEFDWGEMYWTKMKGIVIKIDNEKTEQISRPSFRNSTEFIDLITKSCDKDNSIRPNFDYKKLKVFLSIGGIILITLAIFKWVH